MKKYEKYSLYAMDEETYETIRKLVLGTFAVKCKDRTTVQRNANLRFWRNKHKFSVENGKLFFLGKEVLTTTTLKKAVKRGFRKVQSCGSRPLSIHLKKTYAGLSEKQISNELHKSVEYQCVNPKFTNRRLNKNVTASKVGEKWQIDLMQMKNDQIKNEGVTYCYILSVIDVFSRFVILRPLQCKSSLAVSSEMKKIFAEHGKPNIIQCDQGGEFKGKVQKLFETQNIKMVRSRPYHPQSQGKVERSHRMVRNKISYMKRTKRGFNWARDLYKVQSAVNETPKEVLGYSTPLDVYTSRRDEKLLQRLKEASEKVYRRRQRRELKKGSGVSVYSIGEDVFIRHPSACRVPRRRYILKGKVIKRKTDAGRYQIRFRNPSGIIESCWKDVSDITSVTKQKEKARRKVTLLRKSMRKKYLITKSESDKMNELDIFRDRSIELLHNPTDAGSCQFASVSHQLSRHGIYRTSQQLREDAVKHIYHWRDYYQGFVVGRIDEYLAKMSNEWEYGDHLTLMALSREYNVQCVVVSSAGVDHTVVVSNNNLIDGNRETITLGHFPEHHYVSINVNANALENIMTALQMEATDELDQIEGGESTRTIDNEEAMLLETENDAEEEKEPPQIQIADDTEVTVQAHHEDNTMREEIEQTEIRLVNDQTIDGRVAIKDGQTVPSLPVEIWTMIIRYRIEQDPCARYNLMNVNRMFQSIVNDIPLPEIYIAPYVMLNVPRVVSVRRISQASGRWSGLMDEIRRVIRNPRWSFAWLHLRERDHRWFGITNIWWRNSRFYV